MFFFVQEDKDLIDILKVFNGCEFKTINFNIKKHKIGIRKSNITIRDKLIEEVINLDNVITDKILVVSDDISNGLLRDIVQESNRLGIFTLVLSFSISKNLNDNNGWDSHISDKALYIYKSGYLYNKDIKRSGTIVSYIGESVDAPYLKSTLFDKYNLSEESKIVYIEDSILGCSDIINKLEEVKINFICSSGLYNGKFKVDKSQYEYLRSFCFADIYFDQGHLSLKDTVHNTIENGVFNIINYIENSAISSDCSFKSHLTSDGFVEVLNMDLLYESINDFLSSGFVKRKYKTLGILIKKGNNLLKTLYWYPKLLGCENHIVIRDGSEVADIYARFALTETPALKKLRQRKEVGDISDIYSLENGFTSFPTIAIAGDSSALNILSDSETIYFNGKLGSSTEDKIFNFNLDDENIRLSLSNSIDLMVDLNISKYNHSTNFNPSIPGENKHKVLLVDQRFGDKSIELACSSAETFKIMLKDAIEDYPDSDIIVKVHPDALSGLAKGHFSDIDIALPENVYIYSEDVNSVSLVKNIDVVYVVSSQLGLEAIFQDKIVYSYGVSIYSGWGLTEDRCHMPRRHNKKKTKEELFFCLYIDNYLYIDPISHDLVSFEQYLNSLSLYKKKYSHYINFHNDFYQDHYCNVFFTPLGSEVKILEALSKLSRDDILNVCINLEVFDYYPLFSMLKKFLSKNIEFGEFESFYITENQKLNSLYYISVIFNKIGLTHSETVKDYILDSSVSQKLKSKIIENL